MMQKNQQIPAWSSKQKPGWKAAAACAGLFMLSCLCSTPIPFFNQSTATPIEADTPAASAEPSPIPAQTEATQPIYYYSFVEIPTAIIPEGSVVIMPDTLILAPTMSDRTASPEPATNIRSALEAAIHDARNLWINKSLTIGSVVFSDGNADVVLQGEIFGAGDVLLIAARMQILMTLFTDASVQTALVTLNGDNIGNLGVSNSMAAVPADYIYTRAEVETFMAENAYRMPSLSLPGIWQQNGSMAAGWADRYHFYPSGTFHFYPNEMVCSAEKIEKIGTWQYENSILTLTTTKQIVVSLEVYPSGLCSVIEKKEVELTEPSIEQFTIVDHGTLAGDIYPSISINGLQFWKFSEDASRYGDEEFPE